MRRVMLAIALVGAAGAAPAQNTATVTPDTWDTYRGTRIVAPDLATQEACVEAAKELGPGTYTCRTQTRVVVERAPSCTSPQPPAETRPQECPAGTTGAWSQTRAWISAPYPQCWQAGPYVPAEPPTHACVEPPPPPVAAWRHCANQEEICGDSSSGTRLVRYGVDTRWIERTFTGGVRCNSVTFGTNPASGFLKTCEERAGNDEPPPVVEPEPPPTGSATLSWALPTTASDGSRLTDVSAVRIYYGRSPENLENSMQVDAGTSSIVSGLARGTWYFAVSAVSSSYGESGRSNLATKVIP